MAESLTIARPYARAGFEYASAKGELAQWSALLETAAQLVAHQSVHALVQTPTISVDERAEQFCGLFGADLSPSFKNFIHMLSRNGRMESLPGVSALFEDMKHQQEQVQPVEICSPFSLDDAQLQRICDSVKTRLGKDVAPTVVVDPSLIAGVLIRAGDVVIDGSLSGRLAKLQHSLKI